jgi:serine/threonine protein kinase
MPLADADLWQRGPLLDVCERAQAAMDIAHGLAAAHDKSVIHRDIKPNNVLWFEAERKWKVSDFGLARRIDGYQSTILSTNHRVIGSELFAAPEAYSSPDAIDIRYSCRTTFTNWPKPYVTMKKATRDYIERRAAPYRTEVTSDVLLTIVGWSPKRSSQNSRPSLRHDILLQCRAVAFLPVSRPPCWLGLATAHGLKSPWRPTKQMSKRRHWRSGSLALHSLHCRGLGSWRKCTSGRCWCST